MEKEVTHLNTSEETKSESKTDVPVTTIDFGAKVRRGKDWIWPDVQDEDSRYGIIVSESPSHGDKWVFVHWIHKDKDVVRWRANYRIGYDNAYDLYYF